MFSSNGASFDRLDAVAASSTPGATALLEAPISGDSADAAETRPDGAAPVGTRRPGVMLVGTELPEGQLELATQQIPADGARRLLVVLVRARA